MRELTVDASIENIQAVTEFVDEQLEAMECPMKAQMQIDIAIDELFGNIAHYAYGGDEGEAQVQMDVSQDPRCCQVVFRDKGIPYNPLEKEDPDISLSAGEREIGGLGIYMVKQYMDKVEYRYEEGYNILTIEKRLDKAGV